MTTDCRDLIIAQYRNSPKLVNLISTFCDIVQADLIDAANQLALEAAVNTASGVWLDRIGERVGLDRPGVPSTETKIFGFNGADDTVSFNQGRFASIGEDPNYIPVDDATYRIYLIARGGELLTDGSQPDLSRIAAAAYGNATYLDEQNMATTIILSGVADEVVIVAAQIGLLPKPAGVSITAIEITHPEGAYGFEGQADSTGFNQASFVGVI
jgi:hypothetical protein